MKSSPLKVQIVDGELRISIGVGTLRFSAENSPDPRLTWYDDAKSEFFFYPIINSEEFAKEVCSSLLKEEEDGTTLVHRLLDDVFVLVVEDGSLAIDYDNPKERD